MQPFHAALQLVSDLDQANELARLPGHPNIRFDDDGAVDSFLRRDLDLGELEQLAPRLWMLSKHDYANISALHRQKVKGREIVVTEDPRLHLVWYYDRIFIKPLPKYLLSAAFWQRYLAKEIFPDERRRRIRSAALGYLRTYTCLIRHESDFRIAKRSDLCLIPEGVSWEQFCLFIEGPSQTPNSAVARRYEYGEIRLSRLNFYCKIFLGKQHFQRVHSQYGAYFASFYAPTLFVFGALSVMLSAMQVELATEALSARWQMLWDVCRYFSVVILVAIALISIWLGWLLIYKVGKEWTHALRHRDSGR